MGSSVILPAPGQPTEGQDPGFTQGSIPSAVTFLFDSVSPSSNFFVQQDDVLGLKGSTTFPGGETITLSVRFLHVALPKPGQPDAPVASQQPVTGKIPPYIGTYQYTLNIPSNNVEFVIFGSLGEGFILGANAFASNAVTRGQTYCRVELARGNQLSQVLIEDYVDRFQHVTWPGGTIHNFLEGPGFIHSLQVANPAAGADWTLTVGAHQRLRIESFNAVLTTSATVANRQVQLVVDDGTNIYWQHDANASQTAGTTFNYDATAINIPTGVITTTLFLVMPPGLLLPVGHRLRTITAGIQAADQWSAIFLGVEEWLDF